MSSVNLIGSEDVLRASRIIQSAASELSQAALNIEASLERHQRFLDDWLTRYEALLAPTPPSEPPAPAETPYQPWHGGFCPAPHETTPVDVILRNGTAKTGEANHFNWRHWRGKKSPTDIVEWRIAE